VCPSGIDIRHGAHQLECIGCAKCIDACDGIMESLHKPSGLIRYDAVAMFSTVKPGKRPSIVRPRLFVYAGLWLGIFGVGLYQYVNRAAFHAKVLSTRGADPYVIDGPGVNNLFTVKIANQWRGDESYSLTVSLADGAPADQLLASGLRLEIPVRLGPVAPGTESVFPVLMRAPRGLVGREVELTLTGESSGAVRILRRHIIGPAH
jgi:polyferredoxin